ncbi:hypothetical protein [Niveibacterium sp. SC-1]|uniref:hypothetical protein n=1 Tax=Niveibacterium sp. SC-1 TaxID=3135646 RepID=UPI00311F24C5
MSAMTDSAFDVVIQPGSEGLMATQWDANAEWVLEIEEPFLSELEMGEFETVPEDWV